MNRKLKYGLAVYLFGAAAMQAFLMYSAISTGGIARLAARGVVDILLIATTHLAFSLLWPQLLIIAILQYFGVLAVPFPA
jgi:hypothetical protein